jgi:hypothetical protein
MDGSRWDGRIVRWLTGRTAWGAAGGILASAVPAPIRVGRQHHVPYLPLLAVLAGALLVSLRDFWPVGAPVGFGHGSLPQSVLLEGVVEDFRLSSRKPHVALTTPNGQHRTLQLDLNTTSVFKTGMVLHPAHLRVGQRVRVSAISQPGELLVMARSIEIVKSPQEMEPGPAELSTEMTKKFLRSVGNPISLR